MKRVLLVGIVLMFLLGGCGKDKSSSPVVTAPSLTAEEIIAAASPNLDHLTSFHFQLIQKGGGTPIAMGLEMTGASGDIAPPDRLKMKIEAKWGTQFMGAELVTVGQVTYMTNPLTGKWQSLSEDFTAVTLFQPQSGIKAVMESVTELSRLAEQSVSGAPCFHLRGMLASEALDAIAVGHAAKGLPVKCEIWIGTRDFLLRRVVFDGRITREENDGVVRMLELSRFNDKVDIRLPRFDSF